MCANAFLKHLSYWSHSGFYITLTFDHHHVDVYGADGWLGQTLALLQDVWNITCGNPIVGLSSKRHQLPDSHSWMTIYKVNTSCSVWRKKKNMHQRYPFTFLLLHYKYFVFYFVIVSYFIVLLLHVFIYQSSMLYYQNSFVKIKI